MSLQRKWISILAALVVQAAISGFTLATFTLWAGPWMKAFGASHGEVMSAIMLTLFAGGFFSPLAGALADRIPLRVSMTCGTLLFGVALIAISHATAMWQVALLYAVPVAAGMVVTGPLIGQIIAVRLFHPKPGLAIGVVTLGLSIGGFVVPAIAAWLLTNYNWRECFQYLGVGSVLLSVPVILLLIPSMPADPLSVNEGPVSDTTTTLRSTGAILRDRVFWGALLIMFPLTAFFNAMYYSIGPWLADMNYGPERIAPLISLTAMVACFGIAIFGWAADRVDARLLFLTALACNGGGMIVAATGPSYSQLFVTLPIMGFTTGGMIPLLAALLAKHFGAVNFARANGLSLVFTTTAIVGALLAGIGRDALGNYPSTFAVGLFGLAPCLLGFLLLRPSPQPVATTVLEPPLAG